MEAKHITETTKTPENDDDRVKIQGKHTEAVWPAELIVYKYLTCEIEPFKGIHSKIEKSLSFDGEQDRRIWNELSVRFTLLFIRDNIPAWMGWEGRTDIFSEEEKLEIRNRYFQCFGENDGNVHFNWTGVQFIEAWMKHHFKKATPKRELKRLCNDYGKHLKDAKELMITTMLVRKAISDGLESGFVSKKEVTKFANLKDLTAPDSYNQSVDFLRKLPQTYRKGLDSAIGIERNYLARYDQLTKHFQIIDTGLSNIFLKLIQRHAKAWKKQYWKTDKRPEYYTGKVFVAYHKALDNYKRDGEGEEGYLQHFLAKTLLGEKQHFMEEGEKPLIVEIKDETTPFELTDEIICPNCDYDCKLLVRDAKSRIKTKVVCPSCNLGITVKDSWGKKMTPWSGLEIDSSFKKTPNEDGESLFYKHLDPGMDKEEDDDEVPEQNNEDWRKETLNELIKERNLSPQEKDIIEFARNEPMTEIKEEQLFKKIAKEMRITEEGAKKSYWKTVRKLKN